MISLAINLDTRPGYDQAESTQGLMLNGTRHLDFFNYGIANKVRFFDGYDIETTVYVDLHGKISERVANLLIELKNEGTIDNLVLARHNENYGGAYFPKWNDLNFLNAMMLSRGKYICHIDGDAAMFINDKSVISEWLEWLDSGTYDYISYPTVYSPGPAVDPHYKSYWWASTRWLICRRDRIDYSEIMKCLQDSDYLFGKYGHSDEPRNPWLEHILGMMTGSQERVFYPLVQPNRYFIFSWARYISGTYKKLMDGTFNDVKQYIMKAGGIKYPCDLAAIK